MNPSGLTILMRPDRGRRPYKMHAEMRTNPFPSPEEFDGVKYDIGKRWIEFMKKQGWEYLDAYGISVDIQHPRPWNRRKFITDVDPRPHFDAATFNPNDPRQVHPEDDPILDYVEDVPALGSCEMWSFLMSAIFVRATIVAELDTPEVLR